MFEGLSVQVEIGVFDLSTPVESDLFDRRFSLAYLESTILVLAQVVGDREVPGRERLCRAEGTRTFDDLDEQVVEEVLSLLVISVEHPVEVVEQAAAVSIVETIRRFQIALMNAAHQRFVRHLCQVSFNKSHTGSYWVIRSPCQSFIPAIGSGVQVFHRKLWISCTVLFGSTGLSSHRNDVMH